ncbi:MAG: hypothetical protein WKF41_01745 [Gaiellaceae bacterium]
MAAEEYERLVERGRQDEDVLGLVLTGSRGRGAFVHEGSDWDVRLIVRDENAEATNERFFTPRGSRVEVAVFPLAAFERAGGIGTPNEWDRYSYVHAQVVLDKLDGRIAEFAAEKSVLPPSGRTESPRTPSTRT